MKKIIMVITFFCLLISLAGCTAKVDESAYEAMTDAAINGDYAAAIEYYDNGGAASGNTDVVDWHFYSVAMNDYITNGCLGYSYDLLKNKCSASFALSQQKAEDIYALIEDFDGAYNCGTYYLYINDGKIAVNNGSHLTGTIYCTDEIAYKDGTYYWAKHSVNGEDSLLYTLVLTDSGLTVTPVDESGNMYSGEYVTDFCELPELIY